MKMIAHDYVYTKWRDPTETRQDRRSGKKSQAALRLPPQIIRGKTAQL